MVKRLHDWKPIQKIIVALSFTDLINPYFKDKLFGIWKIIFEWDYHMNFFCDIMVIMFRLFHFYMG